MDPSATLQRIADAIHELDLSGWYSAMLDLANWLANGGFPPGPGGRLSWGLWCNDGLAHVETLMLAALERHSIEIFYVDADEAADPDTCFYDHDDDEPGEAGWYSWCCFPGCMPDSDAFYLTSDRSSAAVEAFDFWFSDVDWTAGLELELSYAVLNVFQRYWWNMWDPLYAVLSRRGNSVDWVTVRLMDGELDRLLETARESLLSGDPGERHTALAFLHVVYDKVLP